MPVIGNRLWRLALVACSCVGHQACRHAGFAANGDDPVVITTTDVPKARIGKAYEARISGRGGTPPYAWRVSTGNLPRGLTLTTSNGVISGVPTAAGWSDFFTIHVQDASGNTASLQYSILVDPVLDEYGSSKQLPCNPTGWFHAAKIGNRWLFCDPLGSASFHISVGGIFPPEDGCDSKTGQCNDYQSLSKVKYGDVNVHWAPQQLRRIESWGFNTVGQLSSDWAQPFETCSGCDGWRDGEAPVKLPTFEELLISNYAAYNRDHLAGHATKDLIYGLNRNYTGWRAPLLDFFDTAFKQWMEAYLAQAGMQPSLTSRWILGISLDDSDYLFGMGAGPDLPSIPPGHTNPDLAYLTLITSPMQTFNPNVVRRQLAQLYTDTATYSKIAMASPPEVCSISSPCSLRDYLFKEYRGSITALNLAWATGGYYTSFDSTGNRVRQELIGTGDDKALTFSHTLRNHPVSPESILVKSDNESLGGDCPSWIDDCKTTSANEGSIRGSALTMLAAEGSVIDYANGQLTLTFKSPPHAGQQITVDYVSGGWMYGTGLMDEDGRHTAWLGTNSICLAPAPACDGRDEPSPNAHAQVAADLDGWISQFSAQYFKTCRVALKKHAPHAMYFGCDTMGTWGAPPRREVLEGAAPYIDGIVPGNLPEQASTDYFAQYLGDKPMFATLFSAATPDSALFKYPGASRGVFDFTTQDARGQIWRKRMRDLLFLKASKTATYPYLGVSWWGLVDFWNEKTNWGLISLNDNSYDGKSAAVIARRDLWGFPTGGEAKDYGDAIDYVKAGNSLWYLLLNANPATRTRE